MPGHEGPSVYHLLNSNVPPKPLEIPIVESRILDLEYELRKLEDELGRHRAILSPVRRMPREVLGHIFTFLQPFMYGEEVRNAEGRKELVDLSLVCKLWHDATLFAHELWAGLQIKPRHMVESFKPVEAWFSHTGSLRRRLQYDGCHLDDCDAFTDRPRLFDDCGRPSTYLSREPSPCLLATSVLPHLLTRGPPLDHLTLMCSTTECFRQFRDVMESLRDDSANAKPRPWDTLRSLGLQFGSVIYQWNTPVQPTFGLHFAHLPFVESLEIHLPSGLDQVVEDDSEEYDVSRLELGIPRSLIEHLTNLSIHCTWSVPHLLKLLQYCSNVKMLTIEMQHFGRALWDLETQPLVQQYLASPLVLPNLLTLRIRKSRDVDLLHLLKAPQLANLDIEMFPLDPVKDEELAVPIATFLEQSGCAQGFRSFRLGRCIIDAELLFTILSNLPSALATLTLDNLVDVAMHRLWKLFEDNDTARGRSDLCFPNLEKLEILEVPPGYHLDAVVDYIKSRGPSFKFQLVASYKMREQRVLKEKDIRDSLRRAGSGVDANVVPGWPYVLSAA
ncbi:hypothetical protein DFP72DRAFT_1149308 [Ephemerocybe angulata]|uniref:F-box domain-containing protein n=1 Tax=Ephemerocybe angulata TaxID=980116 RepID=A0A8H6HJE9_9AGAR|nr:hypothetical protein DFP72DRAFT_1149308 [Tulosesus angulatus]